MIKEHTFFHSLDCYIFVVKFGSIKTVIHSMVCFDKLLFSDSKKIMILIKKC